MGPALLETMVKSRARSSVEESQIGVPCFLTYVYLYDLGLPQSPFDLKWLDDMKAQGLIEVG